MAVGFGSNQQANESAARAVIIVQVVAVHLYWLLASSSAPPTVFQRLGLLHLHRCLIDWEEMGLTLTSAKLALSETLVTEVLRASVTGVAAPGECATRSSSCSFTHTRRL